MKNRFKPAVFELPKKVYAPNIGLYELNIRHKLWITHMCGAGEKSRIVQWIKTPRWSGDPNRLLGKPHCEACKRQVGRKFFNYSMHLGGPYKGGLMRAARDRSDDSPTGLVEYFEWFHPLSKPSSKKKTAVLDQPTLASWRDPKRATKWDSVFRRHTFLTPPEDQETGAPEKPGGYRDSCPCTVCARYRLEVAYWERTQIANRPGSALDPAILARGVDGATLKRRRAHAEGWIVTQDLWLVVVPSPPFTEGMAWEIYHNVDSSPQKSPEHLSILTRVVAGMEQEKTLRFYHNGETFNG